MKEKFDMTQITIGHVTWVMPSKAADALFSAFRNEDIYVISSRWESGGTTYYAKLANVDDMPKMQIIGPVQFHSALENQRVLEEEERDADRKKK